MKTSSSVRLAPVSKASGNVRLAAALSLAILSPSLRSEILNLGTAGDFTVLALSGGTMTINSATTVSGVIGAANNVTVQNAQKVDTFIGQMYVSSGLATSTFQGTFKAATFAPTGGIYYGPGAVDAKLALASTDAIAASARYSALNPTSGSKVLGAVNGNRTLTGSGGLNVYSVSSWSYNSNTLTLTGGAADVFVFNVSGSMDWAQSTTILNGISANQVLFNFTGGSSSGVMVNKSNTVFAGTILSPNTPVIYHNPAVFNGRIIAGSVSLHSAFNITGPPPLPSQTPPIVPPTGTLSLSSNVALQGVTIPVEYIIKRF